MKEGAGMPPQGGAGRSAQTGTEKDAKKAGADKGQQNAQRGSGPESKQSADSEPARRKL